MKTFKHSSQRGLTLIELMIAMLMGVFIIAGILQVFSSSKQAYRLQENLSRLQENGRFAMDYLTKGVRMAGFLGCISKVAPTNIATPKSPNPNPSVIPALSAGIEGRNDVTNNWNTSLCGSNECIVNTDVISFQSASSCDAPVSGNTEPDNANLKIPSTNTCGIQQYDILIVSDCNNANIFVTNNAVAGGGTLVTVTQANAQNSQAKLPHSFGNDAEIYKPRLISYFIRSGASGVPALWRSDNAKPAVNGSNPVELIEGIENMQVLYGVDTDATQDFIPNYYVDASQIPKTIGTVNADWSRVMTVKINLLAVTVENNLVDKPQPYTFNDTTVTPAKIFVRAKDTSQICPPSNTSGCIQVDDLRIRRAFSTTIAIRNRLP